jgi:predicted permease
LDKFLAMANIQASLFIYLAVGYVLRRKKAISDETRLTLSNLVLYIMLPCLVFESFNMDISIGQLLAASVFLLVSLCVCVFSYVLGKLIYFKFPAQKRTIMQYGTLIPNSVFAGLPIIRSAYGALGLFYASVFIIPLRIFMWSAGISMFCDADFKTKFKSVILNPGIIAVVLGLLRLLLHIPLPSFIDTALINIGDCTTALSMMIVGMVLSDIDPRRVFEFGCFFSSFIRLVFLPVLLLLSLKLIGFNPVMTGTAVILAGMPFGSTTAILAQRYGADSEFASKCIFISTVLSLFTIPVISIFL